MATKRDVRADVAGGGFQPIERERLLSQLEGAASSRVILLAAPAGYGKTIVVRQLLERNGSGFVEYCVRPEHDTLLGFVRGLIDALPAPLAALRDVLGNAYGSADRDRPQRLASWLADHLASSTTRVIFIDDVHRVLESSESAIFLASLVACSAPLVRWIFAGRDLSAIPVASWVAYGMAELPLAAAELNFTGAEGHALAKACASTLSVQDVDSLLGLTEGWSTAVALGVKAAIRERQFAKSKGMTRTLAYAYLAEQVYTRLSEEQRTFLLETAVYTVVDLSVLSVSNEGILIELRKQAPFIIDEGPDRFRYHDLFREFLLDELRAAGPGLLETAYRNAASALEVAGRAAEAMLPYLCCGATENVRRLLHVFGRAFVEHGQADIVDRCLREIGGFADDAHLLALRASVDALSADFAASEAQYRAALRLASGETRAEIAYRFATDLLKRGKSEALEVLREAASFTATPELHASIRGTLATAFALHDDTVSARTHIDAALAVANSGALDAAARATVLHQASFVAYQRADAKACMRYADSAAHLASNEALHALEARIYRVQYGATTGFLDDREQGAVLLARMIEVARRVGDVYLTLWALAGSYDLAAERGDTESMVILDRRIAVYDSPARREFDDELASARALRSAWSGDFSNAAELLRGTELDRLTVPRRALRCAEHGVYAAAAGLHDESRFMLGEAMRLVGDVTLVTPHDRRRQVQCLAYVVAGYAILGQYPRANAALRAAELHRRGVPIRYRAMLDAVRGFVLRADTGDDELLRRSVDALERDDCGGLARMLRILPAPDRPSESAIARLTHAEINVLRAIALYGTSANAAEALGRSKNTVSVQVKSILKKLGCASRYEAIAYAREHGLIA